jgi:predicted RNase H-like HicB family nuclease
MTKGDKYTKIVEWSDEDNCFIGSCPELMYGGSHGDHATKVFIELCEMVEEAIETLEEAGKTVPQPLSKHELGRLLQKQA